MADHLHQFNVAVKHARTQHRTDVRAAHDQLTKAMAPLLTRYQQEIANSAQRFRDAMAAAELAYEEATRLADVPETECRQTDACLCPACMARKFGARDA